MQHCAGHHPIFMIYRVFFNISYASSLNISVPLAIHDFDFNGVVYGQDAENDSLLIILSKHQKKFTK